MNNQASIRGSSRARARKGTQRAERTSEIHTVDHRTRSRAVQRKRGRTFKRHLPEAREQDERTMEDNDSRQKGRSSGRLKKPRSDREASERQRPPGIHKASGAKRGD